MMAGTEAEALARWEAVLAACEATMRWAESETSAPASPWVVPHDLGPIPPQLVQRAREICAAQTDALARSRTRLVEVRRELDALRSIPTPAARAVYLDSEG